MNLTGILRFNEKAGVDSLIDSV